MILDSLYHNLCHSNRLSQDIVIEWHPGRQVIHISIKGVGALPLFVLGTVVEVCYIDMEYPARRYDLSDPASMGKFAAHLSTYGIAFEL